jgi:plastocyanin
VRAHPSRSSSRLVRGLGLAAIILAASCGSDGPTEPVPDDEVRVQNNSFSPSTRVVDAGTTVTFRWSAGANTHNVTFNDGPTSPDQSSGTFARTFAVAGSFPYQCTIHSGMNGTITVQ